MLIKFLLKIWPSLIPFLLYFLWIKLYKKNNKIIDATYQELDRDGQPKSDQSKSPGDFSLRNRRFVIIVYISLVIAIICFLFFAIRVPHIENGKYIPAEIKDGKVIPGKIVE